MRGVAQPAEVDEHISISLRRSWVAAALIAAASASAWADFRDDIGYTRLQQRLGASTPTGAAVAVSQVEAFQSETAYLPDASHPELIGKTIFPQTPVGTASSHATRVARFFYGNATSVAPGVTTIDAYDASTWLFDGLLLAGSSSPPLEEVRRIENHSWIGVDDNDPDGIAEILRRVDHVVDRDGVVIVVGINNGSDTPIPALVSSAYNVIAVGLTSGQSSLGPTRFDGPDRVKPDLVAPAALTSWAAPMVAGCAALLVETAETDPARRPETIKALLLAGAGKEPFDLDGRTADTHDDWSRTAVRPLDLRYGAGQVNIDRSHWILTRGQQPADALAEVAMTGWNHTAIAGGGTHPYTFDTPSGVIVRSLSIVVTWNRQIVRRRGGSYRTALSSPVVANIDLSLDAVSGSGPDQRVDESRSPIDNVEHIYRRDLPGGAYRVEVTSDIDAEYAIAWHVRLEGDFDEDGDVDLADYLTMLGCLGEAGGSVGGECVEADFDRDDDVDLSDMLRFLSSLTSRP